MSSAPYHPDDKAIRKTLYDLNILDTPLEERFQRITRMVCATLGVPISAFSIIDGERQWFKSIQGMDATENTRPESFCAYTILGDDVMVVPDATTDKRFSSNPLVKGEPNIAFYAGCPIRAPDGRNIGSLCAIDMKVRHLTSDQVQVLRDLAKMLESELKVAHLSRSQYELISELDAAQRQLLIDPVTRLWNEEGLKDIFKREYAQASRDKTKLSLALIETSKLNHIIERSGRASADGLIKEMAKRFLAVLSPEDSIGRVHGDRFAVLLKNSSPEKIKNYCSDVTAKAFSCSDTSLIVNLRYGIADIDNGDFNLHLAVAEKNLQNLND